MGNGRVAGTRRIRVGSWNVGSLTGKLFELCDVLSRHKVDIACFQETKWKGSRTREGNGYRILIAYFGCIVRETTTKEGGDREAKDTMKELERRCDAAKDSVGVTKESSRTHSSHRESWWFGEEVQTKIAAKHARFREFLLCREGNQEDRSMAKERYKVAKREAKIVVALAKDKAYEDLYKKLDSKEGANDIFKIAKARERRRRDLGNISAKMPDEWRLSEVIPIYKNKGNAQVCSNYRGIKLLGHTMKLWERVIERSLRRETRVLENQFGFMPGRSTTKATHLLRKLMEKYRERQRDLHMAFLDLETVYDSVTRELIWRTLIDKGTPRRYLVLGYARVIITNYMARHI
ncbi:retrovirus-related pol polyprotein LINE-1 [Tanacetum coccineum]